MSTENTKLSPEQIAYRLQRAASLLRFVQGSEPARSPFPSDLERQLHEGLTYDEWSTYERGRTAILDQVEDCIERLIEELNRQVTEASGPFAHQHLEYSDDDLDEI